MADRRKTRKRKDEASGVDPKASEDKPTKEEYAVAKWIRSNVPSKKTKFDKCHNVEYFTGSRAVDALLESSPWSRGRFESREQVTEFLDQMLRHKFFHRAKKVVIPEEELSKIRGAKKKPPVQSKETKDAKEPKEVKEAKEERDPGDERTEERKDGPKKRPKVRLEMHMQQFFVDCNDAYVWIYEPIPVYYWFFGTLVVLGAIGVCLFPLWPLTIRYGVYYISVAVAVFLIFILALAIVRLIVFCVLWLPTLGRCHFWLLPNLTADVGFFASFWPLYQYDYYGAVSDSDKKGSKKKRRKEKDSDTEETPSAAEEKPTAKESSKDEARTEDSILSDEKKSESAEEGSEGSESEKSNTGRDFVML